METTASFLSMFSYILWML